MAANVLASLWLSPWGLWSNMGFLEFASGLSTLILIIGAVIEEWQKLIILARLTLRMILLRSNSFERCTLKKLAIHSIGPILVIAGIVGELAFETRAFMVGDEQTTKDELQIVQLQNDNLQLKPKADKAEKDLKAQEKLTAEAQTQASEAKTEAEDEKIQRLKLEERISPRALYQEDRIAIAKDLEKFASDFAGRPIKLESLVGDPEGELFVDAIGNILDRAHIPTESSGIGQMVGSRGIQFGVVITGPPRDAAFITALVLGIKDRTHSKVVPLGQWKPAYKETTVFVGVKPMPDMKKLLDTQQ
jgi:hypothetical protein